MKTNEQYPTPLDFNHPPPQPSPLHKPPVRVFSIACLLLISLFFALTNPSEKGYQEYVVWKLKQTTCKQQSVSQEAQLACMSLSTLPYNVSAKLLSGYTRRENYLFFSIYTTEAFGLSDRSIGICGRYIKFG